MKKTLLFALMMAASVAAEASDYYMTGSIGSARNTNPTATLTKASDTAFSLGAGYNVNQNLAIELGYANLGKIAAGAVNAKTTDWSLAAVGKMPVAEHCAVIGKLGYAAARTVTSTGATAKHTGVTYGLGAEYAFNDQVSLRAGWDHVGVGDGVQVARSNENIYSVGAVYSF